MDKSISTFEESALEAVNLILEHYKEQLNNHNIRSGLPRFYRKETEASVYQSEICVDFMDENGLFDVIEFFVFRNGIPNSSIEEIKKWFIETLEDVINKR
jgi:hypothetical protein